jgi:hypothetical protein
MAEWIMAKFVLLKAAGLYKTRIKPYIVLIITIAQYMAFGVYFYFELAALMTALIIFQRLLFTKYILFIPFLAFIVLFEIATYYNIFKHNNVWAINIVTCIEFLFYSLFINNFLLNIAYRKLFNWLILANFTYSFIHALFIQSIWQLNTIPILIQILLIISIASRYFMDLIQAPLNTPIQIITQPGFCLCTGVLFFYVGEFLYFASFTQLAYKKNHDFLMLSRLISNTTNAILYTCLIICFLCTRSTKKSYLS